MLLVKPNPPDENDEQYEDSFNSLGASIELENEDFWLSSTKHVVFIRVWHSIYIRVHFVSSFITAAMSPPFLNQHTWQQF